MQAMRWPKYGVRLLKRAAKKAAYDLGYEVRRVGSLLPKRNSGVQPMYDYDSMELYDVSLDFMQKERFARAYHRGMNTGHRYSKLFGSTTPDVHLEFRVHTVLWAAAQAARLEGDFVECGVYTGIFSVAICDYIDFNSTGKNFWLFDTFAGHPDEQMDSGEVEMYVPEVTAAYRDHYETTKKNFADFPRARLVRGKVPDTLPTVQIDKVCYLSIDMNIWRPEVAALEYFWPKMVKGGIVVLDDYGRGGFPLLREKEDEFADKYGVEILTMANGQGLLIKP